MQVRKDNNNNNDKKRYEEGINEELSTQKPLPQVHVPLLALQLVSVYATITYNLC